MKSTDDSCVSLIQSADESSNSEKEDVVVFDDVREIPDGGNSSPLSTECMQNPPSKSGTKEDVVVFYDMKEIPHGAESTF
jgi:hypothetical protein